MADDWRVRVSLPRRSRAAGDAPRVRVLQALRSRIGGNVSVSETPSGVFLMKAERAKSAASGRAAWQVRVESALPLELRTLAHRLEADGFSVARRWRYLIVGASCEDDAHALAEQIRGYVSAHSRIRVQPGVYEFPPVRVPVRGVGYIWV